MHSALLIDEILQLILEVILDDGKSSLCCAARCCQAWKDPSLDRIWRRLPSAAPLLSLLPGFSMGNGSTRFDTTARGVAFAAFYSYAIRVRHIVHCHRILADLTSIPIHLFKGLSNLESARIESRAAGEVVLRMSLAPQLRSLTLQVGYTRLDAIAITVHGMMSLLRGCSVLEQLSVRGHSSECLQVPLSGITTLRSLSLHLSSLTERSLMVVATFPHLMDFDVHADRLSYDILSAVIARASNTPFYPALEKLKIRGQSTIVSLILQRLPRNRLRSLFLDAVGPGPASAFGGLFTAMAALPLHEFTLEHAIAVTPVYNSDKLLTLDHMRPLSKLPLRSLIFDTSLPLDLSDPAIEEMTRWWPRLEQLQLGAPATLENAQANWKPRTSVASLGVLARGCKHLEQLVITLDVDSQGLDAGVVPLGSHPLTSLSISSRSYPDVVSLSAMLSKLFPSLVDVTLGFVGEHEDAWDAVQVSLSSAAHGTP